MRKSFISMISDTCFAPKLHKESLKTGSGSRSFSSFPTPVSHQSYIRNRSKPDAETPNPFCAKLAHSVRAENRSTENAQSASVPPPFPSPGSTPRSFLTPSRHLGPHTQAPRLRPPKPFIWEQQPALYASDRLF